MDAIEIVKSNYIKELLSKKMREDSRSMFDFRDISISTGTIQNAEGSAQVDLGATRVLAGVKLDVGEPMEDTPDQGSIAMSAELLPLASSDFETGPPSPESIEVARVIDRGIRAGNCVDLTSLFIEEGKAWNIFVDVYVLNYDGNLFDAGETAAMAALLNTKVPEYENGNAIREKRTRKLKVDNIVTSCTFGKVDNHIILDPNGDEENAMAARLTVATDKDQIRAMQKGLGGSFSIQEIESLVETAMEKHEFLKRHIEKHR